MNLQDQAKQTRRNSSIQDAMNDTRFRVDRRTESYENVRFDDQVNELHDYLRHRSSQQLKNRTNERENDFSLRQSRKEYLRAIINEKFEYKSI
jgi:hypothetical protein